MVFFALVAFFSVLRTRFTALKRTWLFLAERTAVYHFACLLCGERPTSTKFVFAWVFRMVALAFAIQEPPGGTA